jgi:hypothetical protein
LDFQVVELVLLSGVICPFLAPVLAELLDFPLPLNIGELSTFVESNKTRSLPESSLNAGQLARHADSAFAVLQNDSVA